MTAKKEDPTNDAANQAAEAIGLPPMSGSEREDARREGMKEAEKEAAKESYRYINDGTPNGDVSPDPYLGSDEIMLDAHHLALGPDEFAKMVGDEKGPLSIGTIAGLLKLERAGQNRTPYVKALMGRLPDAKSPYDVTSAGPAYTNDLSLITEL